MKIIAIIEDDPQIGGILERTLAREGAVFYLILW